jgi:hypothetical protein
MDANAADASATLPGPRFLQVFATWFNADLVDLQDAAAVTDAAGTAAADLLRQGETPEGVAGAVAGMLADWTPATAMAFIEATDVDWLADAGMEAQLKGILREMAEAARSGAAG